MRTQFYERLHQVALGQLRMYQALLLQEQMGTQFTVVPQIYATEHH
jgi:hypothetical protein